MEYRRFHRIKFTAQSDLTYQDMSYRSRLENISLRGALISADECIMVPLGGICTLSIRAEEEGVPLVLAVEVVHSFFSMVGVRFVSFEKGAESRLFQLLSRISSEPDQLRQEWRELQVHVARTGLKAEG